MAAFIAFSALLSLLLPSTAIRFPGYLFDSLKQAFILPQDKRSTFADFQKNVAHKSVSLKKPEKFTIKEKALHLPFGYDRGARLLSTATYRAIADATKNCFTKIRIFRYLGREVLYWRFLDSWISSLVKRAAPSFGSIFRRLSRIQVRGCLESARIFPSQVRGSWDDRSSTHPIAKGLLSRTRNARVVAFVDKFKVQLACWGRQVSRSPVTSEIFKKYFSSTWAGTYL